MRVEVARPAQTQLVKLPPDLRLKILHELQALGENPFPGPPKSKRLVGFKVPTVRLRIGDYRVARKDLERIIRGLK